MPAQGSRRHGPPADIYATSFRRQFRVVTIFLLAVNLTIGLFARHQQHAIIDYAVTIYDTAFISTNYVSLAQISFQHYIDERFRGAGPAQTSEANELLETVLDDMDVAVERSSSAQTREKGQGIRAEIAELRKPQADTPELKQRITDIQGRLERLHEKNSGIGLQARDDIEAFSYKSDLLLLCSILTSIMLAGLVLFMIHRMISSLKQRSSDHLYAALEGMPQGFSMFDDEQRLIICNGKYAAMYALDAGLTEPGTPVRAILERRSINGTAVINADHFVDDGMAFALQPTAVSVEHQLEDGRIIALTKAPLNTGGAVTIHMDVTEKRNSEKQIAFLAHHDALTGLANRVQLREHIEKILQQVKRGRKASVLCLDLDNFKIVNDTLGHSVGDALLCAVAKRLRDLVRDTDLVSRTGGDEFSIVQSGAETPMAASAALAARIVEALSVPFELGDHHVLICTIGEWVIRQACAEARKWPSGLRVAVNVSPVQFRNKTLVPAVVSALASSGLHPDLLELEITETVLMMNNDTTLAALHQLRSLGVRISMDDFGTGYSSLSYLRSFPFDKIKIDQSFVRDLIDRPDSIAIIRAVAGLGHSFGMTTTAEGVETQEQLDQMRAEGCSEVQGYFYSKPVPASEIAQLLSVFQERVQAVA